MSRRPKLIVFDLDYTLWPFWVDTHVLPPFTKRNGTIYDSNSQKINTYPDISEMLQNLNSKGYILAVASRTGEIEGANQLLDLLGWTNYFQFKEIYPGSKVTHFSRFHSLSGIDYRDMLFFDDEHRNIRDISQLDVTCILVEKGMSQKVLELGLEEFKKKKR